MRYLLASILCMAAIGILLVPFPGIADITPIDYHAAPSGGGVSPKSSHPTIRMESEEVIIQLKPYTYAVDAVFHMFNSGETTTERIGFPKRAMGRSPGPLGGVDDFIRFEVSVDGRNLPFVEEFSLFKRAQKLLEGLRSRRVEHYSWMMGKARFPGQARTTIRVRYQAQYDNCGFRCQKAVYVYGTGRQWKNTIGKAAFIIDSTRLGKRRSANVGFSYPDTQKNLLRRRLISDTVVRYEIRNLEPDPRGAVSISLVRGESEKNDTDRLVSAARNGRFKMVQALLKKGVDVNTKDRYGNTALKSALRDTWLDRGHLEVARLLVKHGARPTTLPTAAFVGDLSTLQRLMSEGAKDSARIDLSNPSALTTASMGGHIDVVRFLVQHGGEVYTRNKQREAALREGAAAGHSDVVKLLLDMDVDVNARDTLRRSAINRAASQGQAEVVEVLLAGGADIETRDDRVDRTPLMRAAHSGQLEVVKVLLEKGADVNAKDKNDVTALTLANGKDIDEIEKVLKAHGATK